MKLGFKLLNLPFTGCDIMNTSFFPLLLKYNVLFYNIQLSFLPLLEK